MICSRQPKRREALPWWIDAFHHTMEAAIKWFMVFMILTAGDISTQTITKLNKGIISQV